MKRCNECQIDVETSRVTCPLCQAVLVNSENQLDVVQDYKNYEEVQPRSHFVRKLFIFLSIIAIGTCTLVNILTYRNAPSLWSLVVVASIAYLWVLIKNTIMSRRNMAFRLLLQAVMLGILMYFIQLLTPQTQWMIPYVLPFIMISTGFAITFIIFIKTMRYKDYMLYLIIVALIGFIPLILSLVNSTKWLFMVNDQIIRWPSIACAGYAVVTIIGMFLFGDRATKDEFKKRFHV